jgi:hypothetical protein
MMVIEHHAQRKAFSAGLLQLRQALEVTGRCSSGGLDFDADDAPISVLDDDIDFVLFLVPEVEEVEWLAEPAGRSDGRAREAIATCP